jgi:hypothetical protein
VLALLSECAAIAEEWGFAPRAAALERSRTNFTTPGSPLTASMYRDIERGGRPRASTSWAICCGGGADPTVSIRFFEWPARASPPTRYGVLASRRNASRIRSPRDAFALTVATLVHFQPITC